MNTTDFAIVNRIHLLHNRFYTQFTFIIAIGDQIPLQPHFHYGPAISEKNEKEIVIM